LLNSFRLILNRIFLKAAGMHGIRAPQATGRKFWN